MMRRNLERLDQLIGQYVTGSLPEPAQVLVGSHLEMKDPSARLAHALEVLAGDSLAATEVGTGVTLISERERRLAEIFSSSPPQPEHQIRFRNDRDRTAGDLPNALRNYAGEDLTNIPWRMKLPGLRQLTIARSGQMEACLLWARPGRALPHHGHNGLELTLVLEGEFRDHRGNFGQGDVSVADEELDHRPVAGRGGHCLCFSVLFAPIALNGGPFRLLADIIGV